jgi:hypothetical protein
MTTVQSHVKIVFQANDFVMKNVGYQATLKQVLGLFLVSDTGYVIIKYQVLAAQFLSTFV